MNILNRFLSKNNKNSNDLLQIMPCYSYKDTMSIKLADEVLSSLKTQYSDFVLNVGKNDPITKHIKGKIEGIEFMMSLINAK